MASYYRCMLSIAAITWVACNLIGGGEADTISDACKLARDPQFCITSLTTAMGGSSSDLTKISMIAVDLTHIEANRVELQLRASDPRYNICVELIGGTASEMERVESTLKEINGVNFQTVIADVKKGLDDVDLNIVNCDVKLKEAGNTDLIPNVTIATENLTLLTSGAQSVVYYLSQQGLLP